MPGYLTCHPYSNVEHSKSVRKIEAHCSTEVTHNEALDEALTSRAEITLPFNPLGSGPDVTLDD